MQNSVSHLSLIQVQCKVKCHPKLFCEKNKISQEMNFRIGEFEIPTQMFRIQCCHYSSVTNPMFQASAIHSSHCKSIQITTTCFQIVLSHNHNPSLSLIAKFKLTLTFTEHLHSA